MMEARYLVGIDCGTQSAKVVVYDASGNAVATGQQALRAMSRPRHGVAVHPDDDLWVSIAAASRRAMASFTGNPGTIAGVGLCTIRCCKAFLRGDGSLAEPVISWMDDRAYQPYLPDDPSVRYSTTTSGYAGHRFTGELRDTAANNISSQWPIDTDTWQWSDDPSLYEQLRVRPEMLLELQMPGDVVGTVSSDAAALTGIPEGVPVVSTANDKAVEMLGAGSLGDTTALLSLGTYIAAMVHGDVNHKSPRNFWTNFASVPKRYLYESNGVRRGMWTVTWFLDLLGEEVAARTESLGLTREEYIEREAAEVPAGSEGLMIVLDWLAPTDKPFRKGMMLGFDARHSRGHIYRSILEAIALTMKHHVDAMSRELGTAIDDIVVSGGGSSSGLFMSIVADVFGVPTARNVGAGGASLGAAICAAVATGVQPDFDTAAAATASQRETFSPDPERTSVYQRMSNSVYHDIRNHTDPLFERSYPIFH
ncbi:MAG TPA: FGGY-family carbohydrate kinase [Ilumatobacteraceae bacterium]|nr:FGGY-family carbohydrate kinase [Ilumatobacteraceae bacterium]